MATNGFDYISTVETLQKLTEDFEQEAQTVVKILAEYQMPSWLMIRELNRATKLARKASVLERARIHVAQHAQSTLK